MGGLEHDHLSAARRGDRSALQILLLRHYDMVASRLAAWMRDGPPLGHSVEDLVQDTFKEAVRAMPAFTSDHPAAFRKWLRRLARRRFVYHLRLALAQRRGGPGADGVRAAAFDPESVLPHVVQVGPSPRSIVAHAEQLEHLRLILTTVESHYREALRLRYVEQLTFAQIAERTGRSPEAVQMVCQRALRKLRTMMPDESS